MFIGSSFNPLLKMLSRQDSHPSVAVRRSTVGLGIMRYGVRSEPLHSMSVEMLVDAIGLTMQRYLVGDIGRG